MEERMAQQQPIEEGFEVFIADGEKPFGAVRQVAPRGRAELTVYVENAGDFTIALSAVTAVHAQKVIVDVTKLAQPLRAAIARAHRAEDPRL
jgi:hypothetical protein